MHVVPLAQKASHTEARGSHYQSNNKMPIAFAEVISCSGLQEYHQRKAEVESMATNNDLNLENTTLNTYPLSFLSIIVI